MSSEKNKCYESSPEVVTFKLRELKIPKFEKKKKKDHSA